MASAVKPRADNFSARSAVAVFVLTNISKASNSSTSKIRVRASNLFTPLTSQYLWLIVCAVAVLVLTLTILGLFKNFSATLLITSGIVAEKRAI